MGNTVCVRNLVIGSGRPKICVPVMGKNIQELAENAAAALQKQPDLVEWRADYFADVQDTERLKGAFRKIKEILGEIPLIFTVRTRKEGGMADLTAEEYLRTVSGAIETKEMDLVDVEISHGDDISFMLISLAHADGVKVIASSHDFQKTPKKEEIILRLCKMQEMEADIPKIAVMPKSERDVLVLLDATLCMKELHGETPVITMSMGRMGVISRLAGEEFGSAVTFGVAKKASAPGQIDAEKLRELLEVFQVEHCR